MASFQSPAYDARRDVAVYDVWHVAIHDARRDVAVYDVGHVAIHDARRDVEERPFKGRVTATQSDGL